MKGGIPPLKVVWRGEGIHLVDIFDAQASVHNVGAAVVIIGGH